MFNSFFTEPGFLFPSVQHFHINVDLHNSLNTDKLHKPRYTATNILFFGIRTSNLGAEAERSYLFWQFEPEKFCKMLLCYLV